MIKPSRAQPVLRLAGGLAFGLAIGLATAGLEPASASSPQAWADYSQEVQRACLAASRLRQPRPAGDRLDLPGPGAAQISALLLRGTHPQPHMASRSGLELCLYDARTKQARVGDADRLDLKR